MSSCQEAHLGDAQPLLTCLVSLELREKPAGITGPDGYTVSIDVFGMRKMGGPQQRPPVLPSVLGGDSLCWKTGRHRLGISRTW